ncbi:HAMP domain-containing histidine kinase [Bacteroidia bacterium]|nr:HAMP domain-containing histidine kinase [Bacteroidia bacterium]
MPYRAGLRRAGFALQASLFGIIYSLINLVLSSYFKNWMGIFIYVDFIAICLIVVYLIYNKQINTARMLFIISAIVMNTIFASSGGYYAGAQYSWFTLLLLIFTLISIKEKKLLIPALIVLVAAILFCEFTNYEFLGAGSRLMDTAHYKNLSHFIINTLFTSIILFFLSLNFYNTYREKDRVNQYLKAKTNSLRRANQELDNFVYHASHDIRAPLTSMLGLIEIGKSEKDISNVHKLLSLQERTIKRLDEYVNNILTLSRVKRSEIESVEINFKEVINSVQAHCQFMLKDKNIVVEAFDKAEHLNFCSDQHRILTIVTNLMTNSIKFSDAKKKEKLIFIHIEPSDVFDKGVKIRVRDNGIGIKKDNITKVTDMFYYNNDKEMGTGYGLYIVKETVDKLFGKLKIESQFGSFTEVIINLPHLPATKA